MNNSVIEALRYLLNTGESVNATQFDDDHEPIGPLLRKDIAPYVTTDPKGIFKLTSEARTLMSDKP